MVVVVVEVVVVLLLFVCLQAELQPGSDISTKDKSKTEQTGSKGSETETTGTT